MSDTDLELLARYGQQNAEDAFTEVVLRHFDLVYAAALRQVRPPQLAEEVAQSIFSDLTRQPGRFAPRRLRGQDETPLVQSMVTSLSSRKNRKRGSTRMDLRATA